MSPEWVAAIAGVFAVLVVVTGWVWHFGQMSQLQKNHDVKISNVENGLTGLSDSLSKLKSDATLNAGVSQEKDKHLNEEKERVTNFGKDLHRYNKNFQNILNDQKDKMNIMEYMIDALSEKQLDQSEKAEETSRAFTASVKLMTELEKQLAVIKALLEKDND